jgi:PAS domain-containing protein
LNIRSTADPEFYGSAVSLSINRDTRNLGGDHAESTRAGDACTANAFSWGTAMRKNLPATNVEYPVTDKTLIVSRTDTKGRLTYFNDDFIAAAGFTADELMGQPHNIIRHPDMPPEAFENLWDTLKAASPGWAR